MNKIVEQKNDETGYFSAVAGEHIAKGDLLLPVSEMTEVPHRDWQTMQFGRKNYMHDLTKRVNHSFNPNAVPREDGLYALRSIPEGQEITIDYTATEDMIMQPFQDYETGRWVYVVPRVDQILLSLDRIDKLLSYYDDFVRMTHPAQTVPDTSSDMAQELHHLRNLIEDASIT